MQCCGRAANLEPIMNNGSGTFGKTKKGIATILGCRNSTADLPTHKLLLKLSAYFPLAYGAELLMSGNDSKAMIWYANPLGAAVLIWLSLSSWPVALAALTVMSMAANLLGPADLFQSTIYTFINLLEMVAIAGIIRRLGIWPDIGKNACRPWGVSWC